MGHASHDKHEGHSVEMFRSRFWLSLILTLPVVAWSSHIQELLGYDAPTFPGSAAIHILDDATGKIRRPDTFDSNNHVLLTLDAGAAGGHQQTAYFIADETGHTTLRIWNGLGDHVELRAGVDGAHFNAVEDCTLVHQVPEIGEPAKTEMCTELRSYRNDVGLEELIAACRQRMSEEGCALCLAPDR